MTREPLLVPACALAAGILVAQVFPIDSRYLWIGALIGSAMLVCAFRLKPLRLCSACCILLIAGSATQIFHRQTHTPKLNAEDGETVIVSGCVTNPPVFSPNREQFTLNLTPAAAARVSVNLREGEKIALAYGQKVELPAKIRAPRNFQNPDSFDYVQYLAAQQIYWTASLNNAEEIKVLPGSCGSKTVAALFAVRTWALERLASLYPGDQHTIGLLQATLIGETSGVERRWTNDFRVTGTYHALVISGQHVSVLAFTLLLILRILQFRKVPALAVATLASWLYAFISGMSSPVVRAAGGFTIYLIASFFFRQTRILNVLAVVGMIYLAFDPQQLFDPSFQLSFLSAAAIAAFAIPMMERYSEPLRGAVNRFDQLRYDPQVEARAAEWRVELRLLSETLHYLTRLPMNASRFVVVRGSLLAVFVMEAVMVSACVQFGLALPMISYFHRLSITGLSANIVVIPLLSLVVPLGFASIATGWQVFAQMTRALLIAAEWVATWHVRFEPSWRIAAIPLAAAIAFSASLVLLTMALRHKRFAKPALALSLALFALICWQPWPARVDPGKLEVTAIDVSQGDSLLVVFPNGQTMLVDSGGFPGFGNMKRKPQIDMGEDVVSPYLWSRHITHLDYAVLTHGHSDHMGGLASILDNFHPPTLWVGAEPETDDWKNIRAHAAQNGTRIISLMRTSPQQVIGGAQIRFLAPSPDYQPEDQPKNDDSLVFEVRYGERSVLFTGDAESPVEAELAESGVLRPVTVLKVGHHGSKTSTSEDFLNQLQPEFAVISDGYMNQFHHPHPSVMARLADHHVTTFRTDQRGLITFRTDGRSVEWKTYRPRSE